MNRRSSAYETDGDDQTPLPRNCLCLFIGLPFDYSGPKIVYNEGLTGPRRRTRTYDAMLFRHALYHLSYSWIKLVLETGIEPAAFGLQIRCTTNCASPALIHFGVTDGLRTHAYRIHSSALCQLRYGHTKVN